MATKNGVELIADERQRQVDAEGWSSEHDDVHDFGDLALAAAIYAMYAAGKYTQTYILAYHWPWGPEWWKPKDDLRNLVRAGALIAAEIDRLQRLEAPDATAP